MNLQMLFLPRVQFKLTLFTPQTTISVNRNNEDTANELNTISTAAIAQPDFYHTA